MVASVLSRGWKPIFLYTEDSGAFDINFKRMFEESSIAAIPVSSLQNDRIGLEFRFFMPKWRLSSLKAALVTPFLRMPKTALTLAFNLNKKINSVELFFRKLKIDALVCSEDGISGELSVISAARRCGIPVIDVPYGCGTRYEIEFDLDRKAENDQIVTPKGRELILLKIAAPHWLNGLKHKDAIMIPPHNIIANEYAGASLRDSWIIHGGMSDILCAESEISQMQYASEGIAQDKIKLTGSPYCDCMIDALAEDHDSLESFRKARKITNGVTRILVSWPPSYHETYPGNSEFNTYEAMTKKFISFLASMDDVLLTISLHPACSPAARELVVSLGVNVSESYIVGLIPKNDIFCTYFSSTIRWALAAGKIVINYDAYKLGLPTFDSAPGFINTMRFEDLKAAVLRLTGSEQEFAALAERQIADASQWGILDGRCNERILDELAKLVAARKR